MYPNREISNFKLMVHPIEHDISYFKKIRKRTNEILRDTEPTFTLEEQDHFSIMRWHILVNVFQCISTKDGPFVPSIITNRVLENSIRYASIR